MITQEIKEENKSLDFNILDSNEAELKIGLLLQNRQLSLKNQQLQKQNSELKSQIDSLQKQNSELQKQLELLQQKIDYLLRERFSPKSEQLSSNQLSLFADEEQKEIETPKEEEKIEVVYTRAKGNKKRPPKELDRVEVIHDIDEDEKTCKCGCQKVVIGKEITEQYDVIPAKFQVIQHVRLKYGCPKSCEAPKLAPLAPQLLPRHQVSPRLIATIVTQKFEDHLPLHRQAKIFSKRFGVKFNSTTLSDWVIKAYNIAIAPLLYLMQSELNKSDYIQADETTLQVLNEKGKKAKSKSYIWVRVSNQNRKPMVLMDYYSSRAMKNANELFEGFNKGYLQTDGYKGYKTKANKKDVKQLGCWAHTRRKFTDIVKNSKVDDESKKIASNILLKIKKLYDIVILKERLKINLQILKKS